MDPVSDPDPLYDPNDLPKELAWLADLPKKARPPNHRRLSKRNREKLRLRAIQEGIALCGKTTCINELPEGSKYKNCDSCRKLARERKSKQRAKWYDEGFCLDCGVRLEANIRCDRCMEKQRDAYQRRRKESPNYRVREILEATKERAEGEEAHFFLTREWVADNLLPAIKEGACPSTGVPFEYVTPKDRPRNPWLPWINRLDPSKSYNAGNVEVVTWALRNFKRYWPEKDVNYLMLKTLQAHGYVKSAPMPEGKDHCEITGISFKDLVGPWAPVLFRMDNGETVRVVNAYKLARTGLTSAEFDKLLYCAGKEWGYIK